LRISGAAKRRPLCKGARPGVLVQLLCAFRDSGLDELTNEAGW
jgi:hypothetical protein